MNKYITRCLSLLSFVLLTNSWGYSQSLTTATLTSNKDSQTDSRYPLEDYGTENHMSALTYGAGSRGNPTYYYKRSFVQFDLSGIPPNAIIYSANLKLTRTGTTYGSFSWKTKLVTSPWIESGPDHISAGNPTSISNLSGDVVTTTPNPIGYDENIDVKDMVQRMVYGQITNNGWSVQVSNEGYQGTTGGTFHSREALNYKPTLEIQYYIPLSVMNVLIGHESTYSTDDGSICFALNGGASSTYIIELYDGASNTISTTYPSVAWNTSTCFNDLTYGWYGVHVTGSFGEELYQAFIVGVECKEVTINFQPDDNYTSNAYTLDLISGSLDNKDVNFGNSPYFRSDNYWNGSMWYDVNSYMKFNLWMDDALAVNKADLTISGWSHTGSSNESRIIEVTEDWNENLVTWNASPTTSSTINELVSSTISTNQNKTLNTIPFWNDWKSNNANNHGIRFELQNFSNSANKRQFYHSPASWTTSKRPSIEFKVSLIDEDFPLLCNPDLMPFMPLRKSIDGGYGAAVNGDIKFSFKELYQVDTSEYLTINLYDESNDLLASCDASGVTTGGMTALKYDYDDNRFTLNVGSISGVNQDEYYILEVINSKGDKKYLKFLFKN